MFIVNEQIYSSINRTPTVVKSALKDVEFFIQSTDNQLQSDIFNNFDEATERIKMDLEGNSMNIGNWLKSKLILTMTIIIALKMFTNFWESG